MYHAQNIALTLYKFIVMTFGLIFISSFHVRVSGLRSQSRKELCQRNENNLAFKNDLTKAPDKTQPFRIFRYLDT